MFRRILLWFLGMLVFSFVAFVATTLVLRPRNGPREELMRSVTAWQFEQAVAAYEGGGAARLKPFLADLDRRFPARHYLTDAQGRDLATGEERGTLLAEAAPERRGLPPLLPPPRMVHRNSSPDGRYLFVIAAEMRVDPLANLPFYGWIVAVIALLCWVLARSLGQPVRRLRETVIQFGKGKLDSRTRSTRKDELGDLERSFDQMADRIQMLLTAERRLLQDISHELRSPLARLRFAVELARTSPKPEAALERVNREVDRLTSLVGQLLEVTRAEGDPEARKLMELDMASILERVVSDCRIEAEGRGCELHWVGQEHAALKGDPELLHRAVENVVRNAIHHAPQGTAVEVDLRGNEREVAVRVRDYGPGVPEAELENIFRPFYRVEDHRSRENGGGVGLGLSIAERAIRVHHGAVRAKNAEPGLLVEMKVPR
ncbi:MAG: ATP-binding protein [Bryobacteraceae bacterium]|nr:ATP-binding protein [Bryobacteraceae bacterium]